MASELSAVSNLPPLRATGEGAVPVPPRAAAAETPERSSDDDAIPAATDAGTLSQALEAIVERAQTQGAELDFRVDEDSGRLIVSLVDRRDGTVLRQMPSEEALRIARTLAQERPHLIEVRA